MVKPWKPFVNRSPFVKRNWLGCKINSGNESLQGNLSITFTMNYKNAPICPYRRRF
jgi:hypothetical protein